jgi:assimilatory nitrate reductase catalytic subunit
MFLEADSSTGAIRARGNPSFPVNGGELCIKGHSSHELLARRDRLLSPLIRDTSGRLREASWQDALTAVAEKLSAIRSRYGADAVGVFGSGALTNEVVYALGKFARVVLGTRNIDYNGRYCMSSGAAGNNRGLGLDRGLPFPVSDIGEADCVLLWGFNWVHTMPTLRRWFERLRDRGGRIIAVDPRRTATAAEATLHLQLTPGSDVALALGMLAIAVEEELIDHDFIAARTQGFEAARARALEYWPARVEALTGVPESKLRSTVRWLARGPRSLLLSGRGPEQQTQGVSAVSAFINLMLALGKLGVPGSGYGCVTGQGNGQGGREHGQKCDQLPGYRSIEDAADRARIAELWGIPEHALPHTGRSAQELLESAGSEESSGLRGLVVMGSNPVVAAADALRVTEGLRRLEQLVVIDSFLSETAALAHVVLPTLLWAEDAGTLTNVEGRVILRQRVVEPPPGPRSDLAILSALAQAFGRASVLPSVDASEVFDEFALATAGARADYSGMNHARLQRSGGLHWPCPTPAHPGTPQVFLGGFAHPDGRARFQAVDHVGPREEPDSEYPLFLITGRVGEHYNSGTQTRGAPTLRDRRPDPELELHPSVARRLGLNAGDEAWVETRRGRACFRVRLSADVPLDTVFAPFHWGGDHSANRLTHAALDPVSRMPEFKVCAARVTPLDSPKDTHA